MIWTVVLWWVVSLEVLLVLPKTLISFIFVGWVLFIDCVLPSNPLPSHYMAVLMAQGLVHCLATLQVVGSDLPHTSVCLICLPRKSPRSHILGMSSTICPVLFCLVFVLQILLDFFVSCFSIFPISLLCVCVCMHVHTSV